MTLTDLEVLDRAGLVRLWSDLFAAPVPPQMSQMMMRRFLAFELQARRSGGLPPALIARLARMAQGEDRKALPTLRAGARLLREWNGTTHVVDVVSDGYLWNGVRHRSLSAIARAITGARWSGPRFFGLAKADGADDNGGQGLAKPNPSKGPISRGTGLAFASARSKAGLRGSASSTVHQDALQ